MDTFDNLYGALQAWKYVIGDQKREYERKRDFAGIERCRNAMHCLDDLEWFCLMESKRGCSTE